MDSKRFIDAIIVASHCLDERKEEINRLNVFPVPDGDTGTNMSLTLKSVEENLISLNSNPTKDEICKAITTGALMGARGNSGVITSQILRGVCEGLKSVDVADSDAIACIFKSAEDVAYSAVRKPVKGTILTVLSDIAIAADSAAQEGLSLDKILDFIVEAAYDSVKSTPEFLDVLRENGVVDAGGYGLAIFCDAFVASYLGRQDSLNLKFDISKLNAPKVEIEQINDWEDANFRYCNEFLVDSDSLVIEDALDFLSSLGDCELCVGARPKFKVHVHSNEPDKVLKYFLDRGQISEVHIHNMELQSQDRTKKIASESNEKKICCVIAVAAGSGNEDILKSLGVDVVVCGGQTMNPSTKDLLDAALSHPALSYIFLPNNSNIIMAAQAAAELIEAPAVVIPTKSVPESFSSMFSYSPELSAEDNFDAMADAISDVITGEVTVAIKKSKDEFGGAIKKGDVIGISSGKIFSVGSNLDDVVCDLLEKCEADDFDTCTLLAGENVTQNELESLAEKIESKFVGLEVDSHIGGQPLYPYIFSLE